MTYSNIVIYYYITICDHQDLHSFPTRRSSDLKNIRDYLQGSDRPIDRLTKFLTMGTEDGVGLEVVPGFEANDLMLDRKSTRLNSSHGYISYAVFCLKKKKKNQQYSYYYRLQMN